MQSPLTALLQSNPCAFTLIHALGRDYPRCRNISTEMVQSVLAAEGENFSTDQIVKCLRGFSEAGFGNLRWNSESDQFTFAWALMPATICELIRTGQSLEGGFSKFAPCGEDDFDMDVADPLRKHRFQLRHNCTIAMELPEALTRREARKIYKFLKAVAYQVPVWPFSTSGENNEDEEVDELFGDDEVDEIDDSTDNIDFTDDSSEDDTIDE